MILSIDGYVRLIPRSFSSDSQSSSLFAKQPPHFKDGFVIARVRRTKTDAKSRFETSPAAPAPECAEEPAGWKNGEDSPSSSLRPSQHLLDDPLGIAIASIEQYDLRLALLAQEGDSKIDFFFDKA